MSILFFLFLGQIITSNTLFESPTVLFPSKDIYWEAGFTTSLAFETHKDIENHPFDIDIFGYASFFRKYIFALKIYTLSDVAIDFSYSMLPEKGRYPALAFGIRNLSYKSYINSAGSEPPQGGFRDENYSGRFRRNPEILSLYIVATKTITPSLELSLGLGRGEFVGYGPRSKYLNIDYYLNSYHDLAFGLFGGIKVNILPYLSLVGEVDGRDLNIGLKIVKNAFSFSLGLTKLEGLMFVREYFLPFYRLTSALTINSSFISGMISATSFPVYVLFNIYDEETNVPLRDVTIKFIEKDLPSLITDDKGIASCKLMPGNYMVQIDLPRYKPLKVKLNVEKGKRNLTLKLPLTLRITRKEQVMNFLKSAKENLQKGDLYKAKKDYEEANRIYPLYPGLSDEYYSFLKLYEEKLNELKNSAVEYESRGEFEKAIDIWKEVLNLDPENKDAELKIEALSEEIEGGKAIKEESAKKMVEKKVPPKEKKSPYTKEDVDKLLKEAISQYLDKNYEKAKELFKKVLSIDPKNKKALEYLKKIEKEK